MAVLKLLSFLVVIVAILVGSLIAGVPTKMGVWRWVATNVETKLVGMAPAFMSAEHYEYSFEQLRRLDLTGQNAIVTGANVGLGYATSLHLARQGAHVILACRNKGKCANAAASIRANFTAAAVEALVLDTSSLKSVREFVAQVPLALVRLGGSLDMLVLNAGIGILPEAQISVDGIELMFATNHVGHQLLYSLLLPLMDSGGKAGVSRVALVSSVAHFDSYEYGVALSREQLNSAPVSAKGYGQSKLAQVLFAQEATERLGAGSKVCVNALHPGGVDTNIWRQLREMLGESVLGRLVWKAMELIRKDFMWRAEDGALTQLMLAADSAEVVRRGARGKYFHPQGVEHPPCAKNAANKTLQHAVWTFTEQLIAEGPQ